MSNEPKWSYEYNDHTDWYELSYDGEVFHVFDSGETALMFCEELNLLNGKHEIAYEHYLEQLEISRALESEVERLQSELARCKSERLGAEEAW